MKLEQLPSGNLLFNGVEYAPVEDADVHRLLRRLQAECGDEWEVFICDFQVFQDQYVHQVFVHKKWIPVDSLCNGRIYRRRLKRPRELPAVPIDSDKLPVRVTLRCGKHYTATQSKSGKYVLCAERDNTTQWITIAIDGLFLECKKPSDYDIIRVGEWLTAEELEAMWHEQTR